MIVLIIGEGDYLVIIPGHFEILVCMYVGHVILGISPKPFVTKSVL